MNRARPGRQVRAPSGAARAARRDGACRACPLRALPPLRHAGTAQWERFLRAKNEITHRRGDVIFYQGNRPMGLHLLCAGRVKLFKQDASGRVQIVRVVEAPDLLGERAFFAEKPYACTGEAMDEVRLCFLETRDFWELLGSEPQSLRPLLRRFAEELGRAHDAMHCLTVCTVKQRVARHLLSLQPAAAPRQPLLLANSRTELAELLGTTIEAISRTLGEFAAAGWIEVERRRVRILDEVVLRRAACLHC